MNLSQICQLCYQITASYLNITQSNAKGDSSINFDVITDTQLAINKTREIFQNDIFPNWNPINGDISLSFNGGKDCHVLLLLYLSSLWEYYMIQIKDSQYDSQYHTFPLDKLPTVFINDMDTFTTLELFVQDLTHRYNLQLYENIDTSQAIADVDNTTRKSMKDEFVHYLKMYPQTKAIIIGVRHTDPYAQELKPIQWTDSNWPQFIRLQPILHWKLINIWSFLLYSGEPICSLYEQGFTSIGGINNSIPNPKLLKESGHQDKVQEPELLFKWEINNNFQDPGHVNVSKPLETYDGYWPGWYLINDDWERLGRIK